jgi:hypothetical protein
MIELIISGGQTGADQAGRRAAKAAGIPTGGWMTQGFLTEDGGRPEFAELYGARELESPDYPSRTRANVAMADGLIWFGDAASPGGKLTLRLARERRIPVWIVGEPGDDASEPRMITPVPIRENLRFAAVRSLMVAGNRESSSPGIGARAEAYLAELFARLKGQA